MRHLKARLISKAGFGPSAIGGLTVGNVYSVYFDEDPTSCRSVNVSASWGLLGTNWKLQMDGIELQEERYILEVRPDGAPIGAWVEDEDDDIDF